MTVEFAGRLQSLKTFSLNFLREISNLFRCCYQLQRFYPLNNTVCQRRTVPLHNVRPCVRGFLGHIQGWFPYLLGRKRCQLGFTADLGRDGRTNFSSWMTIETLIQAETWLTSAVIHRGKHTYKQSTPGKEWEVFNSQEYSGHLLNAMAIGPHYPCP